MITKGGIALKKILLAFFLIALIVCNVFLLIKMRGGVDTDELVYTPDTTTSDDKKNYSSNEDNLVSNENIVTSQDVSSNSTSSDSSNPSSSLESDVSSNVSSDLSSETPADVSSNNIQTSAQSETDNTQANAQSDKDKTQTESQNNIPNSFYDGSNSNKLEQSLEIGNTFKDYSSANVGEKIGNYAANAYNGGYAVKYLKNVYYIDINNSNYLYFARNNLDQYSKINKTSSWYINVCGNKIFYVNRADGKLWVRVNGNHKKISDSNVVCPVAVDGYIYYINPQEENSLCGEIRRMSVNDYTDEKISPDDYLCENIIPCGDIIFFVNCGKENKSINMLNINTSEVTTLYTGDISDINYHAGALWFIRHNIASDEICKVSVGSDEIKFVAGAEKIDNLIVVKGYAFYMVSSATSHNKCVRIPIDGDTPQTIYDNKKEEIASFNVMDDFIYFEVSGAKKVRRLIPGKSSITRMP